MKIINQWLIFYQNNLCLLVQTENSNFYLGTTTNTFGFSSVTKEDAEGLIEDTTKEESRNCDCWLENQKCKCKQNEQD